MMSVILGLILYRSKRRKFEWINVKCSNFVRFCFHMVFTYPYGNVINVFVCHGSSWRVRICVCLVRHEFIYQSAVQG